MRLKNWEAQKRVCFEARFFVSSIWAFTDSLFGMRWTKKIEGRWIMGWEWKWPMGYTFDGSRGVRLRKSATGTLKILNFSFQDQGRGIHSAIAVRPAGERHAVAHMVLWRETRNVETQMRVDNWTERRKCYSVSSDGLHTPYNTGVRAIVVA